MLCAPCHLRLRLLGWFGGLAAVLTFLATSLSLAAEPAAAHSVSGTDASNFLTRDFGLSRSVDGVTGRVVEKGNRYELTNRSAKELTVLGYEGEPYLRIGPEGVFENRRSPAAYLNDDRNGSAPVPERADADAEPLWERIGSGPTARWHDHRIHWMGSREPPAVRRDPGRRHVVIDEWSIPMEIDGTKLAATGSLLWIPSPSPIPYGVLALAAGALVVGAALTAAWWWAIAAAALAAVAIDVVHLVGAGLATAGSLPERIGAMAAGGYYALIGWVAGIAAAVLLRRRKVDGLFAAGFCGALVAVFGGLLDVSELSRSQLLFVWGSATARILVALSLGLGAGLVLASILAVRRHADVSGQVDGRAGPANTVEGSDRADATS